MPTRKPSTHDRLRTSPQPCLRLVQKWSVVASGSSSCIPCLDHPWLERKQQGDRHRERDGVEQQRSARATRERDQQARDDRAGHAAEGEAQAAQGVGRLEVRGRDRVGQHAAERGREERVGRAEHRGQHHQRRHRSPRRRAAARPPTSWHDQPHRVGGDQDPLAVPPVGPDPGRAGRGRRTAGTAPPTPAPRRPRRRRSRVRRTAAPPPSPGRRGSRAPGCRRAGGTAARPSGPTGAGAGVPA